MLVSGSLYETVTLMVLLFSKRPSSTKGAIQVLFQISLFIMIKIVPFQIFFLSVSIHAPARGVRLNPKKKHVKK